MAEDGIYALPVGRQGVKMYGAQILLLISEQN